MYRIKLSNLFQNCKGLPQNFFNNAANATANRMIFVGVTIKILLLSMFMILPITEWQ